MSIRLGWLEVAEARLVACGTSFQLPKLVLVLSQEKAKSWVCMLAHRGDDDLLKKMPYQIRLLSRMSTFGRISADLFRE